MCLILVYGDWINGCSKHMLGDKTLFKEFKEGRGGKITYENGSQSKVIGKGTIEFPGFPTSQEALYVERLKANLLNISRFCDNDLVVQFSKKECNIFDCNGKWLMGGERTIDNCYGAIMDLSKIERVENGICGLC
jgi:hypothetical protein